MLFTPGFFLLVINALMLLLVSALVRGFTISGFWTAFFASIVIAALSFLLRVFLPGDDAPLRPTGKGIRVEASSHPTALLPGDGLALRLDSGAAREWLL